MKKYLTLSITTLIALTLAACGSSPNTGNVASSPTVAPVRTTAPTATPTPEPTPPPFVLTYPEDMQGLGFTEELVFETIPENIVSLSAAPVLALYHLGANLLAVPSSSVVSWPDDLDAEILTSPVHSTFDIEIVVALEPDLVILPYTSADTHGATLTGLKIPVYYVAAGHTVSYDSIKTQTQALIDAFGIDEDAAEVGEKLMQDFADLESRLEDQKVINAGKSVMALQSGPPSHYIQTSGGTLASMLDMMGFDNVYENEAASMALLDLEVALEYRPDLVFAVGMSPTGEGHKEIMEADFANNPDYWNSIEAIANGDIIYLPVNYVSTAGINVIDNINQLIDIVAEHYAN